MRRMLGLLVAVTVIGTACGWTSGATPTPEATPIPFHAVPADVVGVTGTATCSFSNTGTDPEGGAGFRAVCELDMSDPRVNGTDTSDRYRFYDAGELGSVWVAEEDVITNEEGSWRGIAQAADDGTPCGEAHFVGEGAYEGLEFHYYFCHVDEQADVRGWISGGG